MEYQGKLYGKVGKSYFPLVLTTKDVDKLESENEALQQMRQDYARVTADLIIVRHENERLKIRLEEYSVEVKSSNAGFMSKVNELKTENERLKAELTKLKQQPIERNPEYGC